MFSHKGHVMTLANSIIGVGILAMPFCFQKCGIILAILLLIINYLVTRISCHYLIKSAFLTRRKSFELLAFHAFGSSGKLMVELCMIGYLIGSCITYFVVVGDLGPQIIAKIFEINENDQLRTWTMIIITILCVIPLGLLKNVDSLSAVCTAAIGFYFCLVIKVISESSTHISENNWHYKIEYWRPSGILQCLPIFSMALSCQMQLFEVLEAIANQSLDKCNEIVKNATKICTFGYICVGFFGYIAFCDQTFSGNVLINFSPSLASDAIKIGFVISVAFSFPLVIFPCRASLYSLLYRRGHSADTSGYIPENRFKIITIGIVLTSLCLGILIPSIEIIIGLVGSTIGVIICVMFPASCFLKISSKESSEKTIAKIILVSGFLLMILGTYANLNAIDERPIQKSQVEGDTVHIPLPTKVVDNEILKDKIKQDDTLLVAIPLLPKNENVSVDPKISKKQEEQQEPVVELPKTIPDLELPKMDRVIVKEIDLKNNNLNTGITNNDVNVINKDAIKKEEEIAAEEKSEDKLLNPLIQAENELKRTKELLSRKVDELKHDMDKQNKETQNKMIEKLDDIAEKVEEIERKVKDVNEEEGEKKSIENLVDNKNNIENNKNEAANKLDQKANSNLEEAKLKTKSNLESNEIIPKTIDRPLKSDTQNENIAYKIDNRIMLKSSVDPIVKYVDNGNKKQKINKIESPNDSLLTQISYTVQKSENDLNNKKPVSYKAGEMLSNLNLTNMKNLNKPLISLPFLLNSTINQVNEKTLEKIVNKKELNTLNESNKNENKENVQAIRRDILETKNILIREKRDINEVKDESDKCYSNCLEDLNVNKLVSIIGIEKMGIGRDLKSVKDQ